MTPLECSYPLGLDVKPKNSSGNQTHRVDVSCGRCKECRINRQSAWTGRILLETQMHLSSYVVTLTYDDLHHTGNLDYDDVQRWLKRLRKRLPFKLRYFVAGEIGKITQRAHWHALLFGIDLSQIPPKQIIDGSVLSWGAGHIFVDSIRPEAARYVTKYCMKKADDPDDPAFAHMSLKPGIGMTYIDWMGERLANQYPRLESADLIQYLHIDGKRYVLDRYTRNRLIETYRKSGGVVEDKPYNPASAELLHFLIRMGSLDFHDRRNSAYARIRSKRLLT